MMIHVETDLVAAYLPDLRTQLRDLVRTGAQDITVDLEKVQMVDSAGMGLLIATHNSLKKEGAKLAVINASGEILELLKAMRLHQHFSITGSGVSSLL